MMKKVLTLLLVTLMMASALALTSCIWGPTIAYNWQVESHSEFVEKIEQFNSTHDEFVNTFISFDLDEKENISKAIYHFDTVANKSAVHKYGLCDKTSSTYNIDIMYYIKSTIEDTEKQDYAYQVGCYYRDVRFNFSKLDKIEIKQGNTYDGEDSDNRCTHTYEDKKYPEKFYSDPNLYNHMYHYEMFVNGVEVACIHISSIEEASKEKLDEIIQILRDSLVLINTEN